MRFVIDLYCREGEAYGQVRTGESGRAVPFASWLDLLRLLEAADVMAQPAVRLTPSQEGKH